MFIPSDCHQLTKTKPMLLVEIKCHTWGMSHTGRLMLHQETHQSSFSSPSASVFLWLQPSSTCRGGSGVLESAPATPHHTVSKSCTHIISKHICLFLSTAFSEIKFFINSNSFVVFTLRWFPTRDQTSPQQVWLKAAHLNQAKMNAPLTQERCSSPFLCRTLAGPLR